MSDKQEIPVVEDGQRNVLDRMRKAGFKGLYIGIQYFATRREKAKQTNEGSSSTGGTSAVVICDSGEGRVDAVEQYVIPILNGPIVPLRGIKEKGKGKGRVEKTRDDE